MMQRALNLLAIALLFVGTNPPLALAQTITQTQQSDRKSEADRLSKQGLQYYQAEQHEAAISSWEVVSQILFSDKRGISFAFR